MEAQRGDTHNTTQTSRPPPAPRPRWPGSHIDSHSGFLIKVSSYCSFIRSVFLYGKPNCLSMLLFFVFWTKRQGFCSKVPVIVWFWWQTVSVFVFLITFSDGRLTHRIQQSNLWITWINMHYDHNSNARRRLPFKTRISKKMSNKMSSHDSCNSYRSSKVIMSLHAWRILNVWWSFEQSGSKNVLTIFIISPAHQENNNIYKLEIIPGFQFYNSLRSRPQGS